MIKINSTVAQQILDAWKDPIAGGLTHVAYLRRDPESYPDSGIIVGVRGASSDDVVVEDRSVFLETGVFVVRKQIKPTHLALLDDTYGNVILVAEFAPDTGTPRLGFLYRQPRVRLMNLNATTITI